MGQYCIVLSGFGSMITPHSSAMRSRKTWQTLAGVTASFLVATAASARAQADSTTPPAPKSPKDAVQMAFDAVSAKQWKRVAQLADPDFLTHFRDQQLVYAQAEKISKENQKKNEHQYGLPKCVQKYFESQESHFTESFLKGFAGVNSVDQLSALTPQELYASWLAGSAQVSKDQDDKKKVQTTRTLLGEVPEGDTVSYVLYRLAYSADANAEPKVLMIKTRRGPDGWRIFPNDDITLAGRVYFWGKADE